MDIISAVEFDDTGKFLATGDRGGRVVLFERNEDVNLKIFMKLKNQTFDIIKISNKILI